MGTPVRIEPSLTEITAHGRRLSVSELHLGGIPRGAVVLLRSGGATDYAVVESMNGLAEHGYESVAADLAESGPVDDETALGLLEGMVELIGRRGWTREQLGVVGYGFGGRVVLIASLVATFGAAVSVDPERVADLVEGVPIGGRELRTPWLGMFGGDDRTTPDSVEVLDRVLGPSPVYTQAVTYTWVSGAFYLDTRGTKAHAADFDSWQRVLEWLNARVVPRLTPLAEAWRARQLVQQ